jgi:hypothetical protein
MWVRVTVCVMWYMGTNISEVHTAYIFRTELLPRRQKQDGPLKHCQLLTRLSNVTPQRTTVYTFTDTKTSNLTEEPVKLQLETCTCYIHMGENIILPFSYCHNIIGRFACPDYLGSNANGSVSYFQ